MSFPVRFLLTTNKVFPKVIHPFNLQNSGEKTYAQWQFERGMNTISCFTDKYTPQEMFEGKNVLDMGCGAAGKSLYYVSIGAAHVTGVDIVEHYKKEAEDFASRLGYAEKFDFIIGDAAHLPFENNTFDTIIMNDFMEHISEPENALREGLRLLKQGGRIYINFPPYYHPTGAHMSDVIGIPWVHMFFSEKTLISAYKQLVSGLPDEQERISLRISTGINGQEQIGYINKMTLKRFQRIIKTLGISPVYYREMPLRNFLKPLAVMPGFKEMFVKMGVCVIEK